MKYTDLKIGGYYVASREEDTWYIKIKDIKGESIYCHVNFTLYSFYGPWEDHWTNDGSSWDYREATYYESLWIEECLQEETILPFKEIAYEIY